MRTAQADQAALGIAWIIDKANIGLTILQVFGNHGGLVTGDDIDSLDTISQQVIDMAPHEAFALEFN